MGQSRLQQRLAVVLVEPTDELVHERGQLLGVWRREMHRLSSDGPADNAHRPITILGDLDAVQTAVSRRKERMMPAEQPLAAQRTVELLGGIHHDGHHAVDVMRIEMPLRVFQSQVASNRRAYLDRIELDALDARRCDDLVRQHVGLHFCSSAEADVPDRSQQLALRKAHLPYQRQHLRIVPNEVGPSGMFMKVHEPSIKRYAENGNLFSAYFTENRKEITPGKTSLSLHLSFVLRYRKVHSMGKCINDEEKC